MRTDELDFNLPPDLIAQEPAASRDGSRLLHYNRTTRAITDNQFADLPGLLRAGDLLVLNDSRVLPARFTLIKPTGGLVEGLFVRANEDATWLVMLKNVGPLNPELMFYFAGDEQLIAQVLAKKDDTYQLQVRTDLSPEQVLQRVGRMPLPPYIRRAKKLDVRDERDRERYQNVFASTGESIAAPTAGLHFTPELLEILTAAGIQQAFVKLHVGAGTFKTVSTDSIEAHPMHAERYSLSASAADLINRAKHEGRRVIAVGTTTARVLESQPEEELKPVDGSTSILIYPPYRWKHLDGLITNFHLPRSTLVALVAAMVGLDEQRRIYAHAIAQQYRFFSYGDAMLVT